MAVYITYIHIVTLLVYGATCRPVGCPPGWIGPSPNSMCYLYPAEPPFKYSDATQYCLGESADMAMPRSLEEEQYIIDNIVNGEPASDKCWFGLAYDSSTKLWKWTDGRGYNVTEHNQFLPGEPTQSAKCALLESTMGGQEEVYQWATKVCSHLVRVLCQTLIPDYECDEGFVRAPSDQICYKNMGQLNTSTTAFGMCSENNLDVFMPRSIVHNQFMRSVVTSEVWIGLTRQTGTSPYQWIAGNQLGETFWDVDQPSDTGMCAVFLLIGTGYWRAEVCTTSYTAVCQCGVPVNGSVVTGVSECPSTTTTSATTTTTLQTTTTSTPTTTPATTMTTKTTTTPLMTTTTLQTTTTTNTTTTTTSSQPTTTGPISNLCSCTCTLSNITELEYLTKKIQKFKTELAVQPKKLSSSIMALKCADDLRPSARTIGYSGVIFMVVIMVIIIFFDCISVFQSKRKSIKRNIL